MLTYFELFVYFFVVVLLVDWDKLRSFWKLPQMCCCCMLLFLATSFLSGPLHVYAYCTFILWWQWNYDLLCSTSQIDPKRCAYTPASSTAWHVDAPFKNNIWTRTWMYFHGFRNRLLEVLLVKYRFMPRLRLYLNIAIITIQSSHVFLLSQVCFNSPNPSVMPLNNYFFCASVWTVFFLCFASFPLTSAACRQHDSRRNHKCEGGGDHQGDPGLS